MSKNPGYYPAPRELGLLERAITGASASPLRPLIDYMVAIDRATGKIVDVWKGSAKRLSLGDDVVQYHAPSKTLAEARRKGGIYFHANQPGA